jgi:hypothetical protein
VHYWALSRCPVCDRRDHAWLLESGKIKCFADTCDASGDGLPLSQWMENETSHTEKNETPEWVDVDYAKTKIQGHLKKEGDLALTVTSGIGHHHSWRTDSNPPFKIDSGIKLLSLFCYRQPQKIQFRTEQKVTVLDFSSSNGL